VVPIPFLFSLTFVNFLRAPDSKHPIAPQGSCTKTNLRRTCWRGAMILPMSTTFSYSHRPRRRLSSYANAFPSCSTVLASSVTQPRVFGHQRKSDTTIGIDIASCYFYVPEAKLIKIAQHARKLIGRATRNARWLPVKDLQ
jgi:hypothetical protein